MRNKFKKTKTLLVGALVGVSMFLPNTGMDGVVEASSIDGKCSITIDANKHVDQNFAYGTGKCKERVMGVYGNGNYSIFGAVSKSVRNGQVEQVVIPPFDKYELTVYTVKPGENPKPQPEPEEPKPQPDPKPDPNLVFKDVPKSFWAYNNIMDMHSKGIVNGYTDGTYKPHQSIIRMHVAMLFARSVELEPIRQGKEFTDVPKSHRAYEDIQKVYRAGIFDGKKDGSFGINDKLTRGQMAKVLFNAFDLEKHEGYIFNDVTDQNWEKFYISSLYMSGITVGSNGNYLPKDSVSRAHYAVFLHRALNQDTVKKPTVPLRPSF